MEAVECIVLGAGAVGLAVARALALRGCETVVLEAQPHIGTGESSRNSEVIHAGIYYPRGSLKERLCVSGRALLYRYCELRAIAHQRCGKLIVATSLAQLPRLEALRATALAAGVTDLRLLSGEQARALEPELNGVAALDSPSTGIIDSHAYMLALQGDAEAHNAVLVFNAAVSRLSRQGERIAVTLANELTPTLAARIVVNSTGLGAQSLAMTLPELGRPCIPALRYAKGNYFSLARRSPFKRLIYPIPEPGGLGIHLTLDLEGRARFGPDVQWIDARDYQVDARRQHEFFVAVRRYWPNILEHQLLPAYAGIRAKLSGPGEPAADFVISSARDHGIAGLVNLFGIESPGLTSSLAIGEHVADLVCPD